MNKATIVFLDSSTMGEDFPEPDFSALGTYVPYPVTRPEQVVERIRDAEIVLTNKVCITAEHMAAAPKLAYIGTVATGYNQVDIAAAAKRGIPVCNVPDYSTHSVVQHVFTLLLALSSQVCELGRAVRGGEWSKKEIFCFWDKPSVELHGKTMGVVGFGDIGSHVAALAHAFGMKVLAHAPRPKPVPGYEPFAFVGLDELFARSDVVSLHCPLTPENTGMVNASLLRTMKPGAYLINTARGPLVNESDLAAALAEGTIAGAGLDVVCVEPMPDDNPLRLVPNCLITPHVAWSSIEARTRLMDDVKKNIRCFLDGKPVNVKNGLHD
ncbi:D-2-hydroxyacid dehydrogenase [Desulfovibrio sp. OttesenSCG-928-G15]|nr:D-2-hydroxyacid dehydrogenase [Desulfovibrio sp. OttesenSCG-928-G15]